MVLAVAAGHLLRETKRTKSLAQGAAAEVVFLLGQEALAEKLQETHLTKIMVERVEPQALLALKGLPLLVVKAITQGAAAEAGVRLAQLRGILLVRVVRR